MKMNWKNVRQLLDVASKGERVISVLERDIFILETQNKQLREENARLKDTIKLYTTEGI